MARPFMNPEEGARLRKTMYLAPETTKVITHLKRLYWPISEGMLVDQALKRLLQDVTKERIPLIVRQNGEPTLPDDSPVMQTSRKNRGRPPVKNSLPDEFA